MIDKELTRIKVEELLKSQHLAVTLRYNKRTCQDTASLEDRPLTEAAVLINKAFPEIGLGEAKDILGVVEIQPYRVIPKPPKPAKPPKPPKPPKEKMDLKKEITIDMVEAEITYSLNGITAWTIKGAPVTDLEEIVLAIWGHRGGHGKDTICREDITAVLMDMIHTDCRARWQAFLDKIQYDPQAPDLFEALARQITGKNYDRHYPVILRHIYWTIKRRIHQLPDYCPIFMSIYGPAGTGKTELTKAMFAIIPSNHIDLVTNAKSMFEDTREHFRFVDSYVCIMDELGKMGKTDINFIKTIIDAPYICYRLLGWNQRIKGHNNAQLVGTSNTRLKNIIQADSDIRKWAEIDIMPYDDEEVPEKMIKPLLAFDWISVWKSIDEKGKSPFHEPKVYDDFKAWTAKKCEHESDVLIWLRDYASANAGQWVSTKDLYQEYKNSVDYPLSRANFKEAIEKHGFDQHRRARGDGYMVPGNKSAAAAVKAIDHDDIDAECVV